MSTPATLKKIEEAKVKAQQRKATNNEKKTSLAPLTNYTNGKNFSVSFTY